MGLDYSSIVMVGCDLKDVELDDDTHEYLTENYDVEIGYDNAYFIVGKYINYNAGNKADELDLAKIQSTIIEVKHRFVNDEYCKFPDDVKVLTFLHTS